MILTFKALQDQVLTFLDQAGDTGTGLDLVKFAIQTAHDRRVTADRWSFMLWPDPVEVEFTRNGRNFILHPEMQFIADFVTTDGKPMVETPTRSRFKQGAQDDRFHYEFVQPSPTLATEAADVLTVAGGVRIRYVGTDDVIYDEEVTNSTTGHAVARVLNVTRLTADEVITLTDADSVEILALATDEDGKQYPQIRLFSTAQGDDATYRFYRKPSRLTANFDVPDVPYPFTRILVFDALLELATYNDSQPPAFWSAQQQLWERQLEQAYLEGMSEGGESRQVIDADQYEG